MTRWGCTLPFYFLGLSVFCFISIIKYFFKKERKHRYPSAYLHLPSPWQSHSKIVVVVVYIVVVEPYEWNFLWVLSARSDHATVLQGGDKSSILKMSFWYLSVPIWLWIIILNIIWYNLSKIFGCHSFRSTKRQIL